MKVELQDVSFGYYSNISDQIIKGFSHTFSSEKVHSIVGVSGSGKSTLIRLIAGLLPSNKKQKKSGTLTLDGKANSIPKQQGKIAFMFQEPALMPNKNVWKNVTFPLALRETEDRQYALELTKFLGLSDYHNYYPHQLSGGMKTRVALAMTFVTRPQLILLDEPFSSLDIDRKFLLYNRLLQIVKDLKCTIILVTHDIHEAMLLSNELIVLNREGEKEEHLYLREEVQQKVSKKDLFHDQEKFLRIAKMISNYETE